MLNIDQLKNELLAADKIGAERLATAEKAAADRNVSLTEELATSLVLDFADLGECCSKVTELPYVPLLPKPPSDVALRLISPACAKAWEAFPVEYDPGENTLWFAIHDPDQQKKLEGIYRFLMQPQRLGFTVAPDVEIARACNKHFGGAVRADRAYIPHSKPGASPGAGPAGASAQPEDRPAKSKTKSENKGGKQKKRQEPVYEDMHRSLMSMVTLLVRREHGDTPEVIHDVRTRVRYCQLLASRQNLDRLQTDGLVLAAWILGLEDGLGFARRVYTPYGLENILEQDDETIAKDRKYRVERDILGLVLAHETLRKVGDSQSRDVSKVRRELQLNWSASPGSQDLLESFLQILIDDEFLEKIGGSDGRILIVDPEEESTGDLVPSLTRVGYNAVPASNEAHAREKLKAFSPDLVIIEMSHDPKSALRLCESLTGAKGSGAIPVLALVPEGKDSLASKCLRAGAHDFLRTPLNMELLLLKIQACLADEGSANHDQGVSGTLDEMTFTDMIQILCAGRKDLEILLTHENHEGRVYVSSGEVLHATVGDFEGEAAFYELMRWKQGRFSTNRCTEFPVRTITSSTMSLLMEGARQVDELLEAAS